MHNNLGGTYIIWLSLLVGSVLAILPLPDGLALFRPAWLPLIFLFWQMTYPDRFGLLFAWILGIYMDVLVGVIFGQNAMAMLVMAMTGFQVHRRFRMYPVLQQSFMTMVIVGLYQLVALWINSATGYIKPNLSYVFPVITSAFIWPWLVAFLRFFSSKFVRMD